MLVLQKRRCRPTMSHPVHGSGVYVFAFGMLGAKDWAVNRSGPTSSGAALVVPAELGFGRSSYCDLESYSYADKRLSCSFDMPEACAMHSGSQSYLC